MDAGIASSILSVGYASMGNGNLVPARNLNAVLHDLNRRPIVAPA